MNPAKREGNPMNLVQRMNAAPRCSAMSKRSRRRCRAPAVRGWRVCRFHGAQGGAPKGKANGAWSTGNTATRLGPSGGSVRYCCGRSAGPLGTYRGVSSGENELRLPSSQPRSLGLF
jgi:hypothetical protein